MGKVKSAILTVLFSVVLAVLCALCVLPSFTMSWSPTGTKQDFNSVLKVMKLDPSLGGASYTTYYPEGVIPASEYNDLAESEAKNYTKHGSLYLYKDVMDGNSVDSKFVEKVNAAVDTMCYRFENVGLSYLKIELIDDFALRVEIPSDVTSASNFFGYMGLTGEFTLRNSMKTTPMLKATTQHSMDEYFKKVSTRAEVFIQVDLTKTGREKIADISSKVATNEDDQEIGFYVGDIAVISMTADGKIDENTVYLSGYNDAYIASAVASVISSCIFSSVIDFEFQMGEVAAVDGLMGSNMPTLLYIGVGIVMLAIGVFSAVRYRGFGAAHIYAILSYLVVVTMCLSFIESITFSLGSVLAVLFGGVLLGVSCFAIFENVKKQSGFGKRIISAMKDGYVHSLATVIDVHAIVALASIFLAFVTVGEASAFGVALFTATLTSAACTLLIMPALAYLLKGMAKDEYKFCNLKREVIDDED